MQLAPFAIDLLFAEVTPFPYWTVPVVLFGVALAVVGWLARPGQRRRREVIAMSRFHEQREHLEALFLEQANRRGKPRGVRWIRCDWGDEVRFAREKNGRLLTAFVPLNVGFEPIEGGDMEDVEAVRLIRSTTGLFHYDRGGWGTGGRALFNMSPDEALQRLSDQYEPIEPPGDSAASHSADSN